MAKGSRGGKRSGKRSGFDMIVDKGMDKDILHFDSTVYNVGRGRYGIVNSGGAYDVVDADTGLIADTYDSHKEAVEALSGIESSRVDYRKTRDYSADKTMLDTIRNHGAVNEKTLNSMRSSTIRRKRKEADHG